MIEVRNNLQEVCIGVLTGEQTQILLNTVLCYYSIYAESGNTLLYTLLIGRPASMLCSLMTRDDRTLLFFLDLALLWGG